MSGALALLVVTAVVYALMAAAPGDPVAAVLGVRARTVTSEERERLREQLGLNAPAVERYFTYLLGVARGDLGRSYRSQRAVGAELRDRIPYSLTLAAVAAPLALLLGVAAGVIAAARSRTWLDTLISGMVALLAAVPAYITALLMMLVFALALGWVPATGSSTLAHLVLPAATLALSSAAPLARLTRSSLLDALAEPHVTAARARGLSGLTVLVRHGLRNAALPVVTVAAIDFGRLLGGAVFVEAVFGWPGLGRLLVDATAARDTPLVLGVTIVGAVSVIVLNLLADLAYLRLEPRLRYR